jgi:hypothetical protein
MHVSHSNIRIPISGSSEESKFFERDISGNKFADGVTWKCLSKIDINSEVLTYEKIGQLDVIPEIFPNLLLGRSWDVDKITADFDVRAVDNGKVGPNLLDKRNETGHLGII